MSYETSHASTEKINSNSPSPFARWFGWGFCVLIAIASLWEISKNLPQLLEQFSPMGLMAEIFFRLFPLVFAVLATLIINRQPSNIVGWLLALPAFGGGLTLINEAYFQNVVAPPVTPSFFFLLMVWVSNISWTLFIFPIILIPLFFPNGRPPSAQWNWVGYYAIGLLSFFYVVVSLMEEFNFGPESAEQSVKNPIGIITNKAFIETLFGVPWAIALLSLVIACIAALVTRYRRGTNVERAQIKWVVYASIFFGTIYIALFPISMQENSTFLNDLSNILFAFSLSVVPIGISVAILRYRLWDIDFVINRSLVYGALTALLVILFVGSLLIINNLFQTFAGGPLVAVTISAAVFGAFFQPARRKLQRFVDRRFYNIQIDYNKTPAPVLAGVTNVIKQTHFGEYQNLELIGRGGMAEIYKSVHPTLGTPVAIKVLPSNLASDPDFRKRFIREAQTVAKLQHPHIIRVFDYGEMDGTNYMVMEYIGGKDLAHYLSQRGRLSLTEILSLLKGIAEALDYAHTQGLVHRDVKPSNILLDIRKDESLASKNESHFFPLLTDFGIAKILDGATRFTETGGMLGTFDYIAPEQIQGAKDLNAQADIYSFGVVVYQMLTGSLPFQHNNLGALLMAHVLQPAPDPRDIVPDITDNSAYAIQRAMAKQPQDRFMTVGEFVAALL